MLKEQNIERERERESGRERERGGGRERERERGRERGHTQTEMHRNSEGEVRAQTRRQANDDSGWKYNYVLRVSGGGDRGTGWGGGPGGRGGSDCRRNTKGPSHP